MTGKRHVLFFGEAVTLAHAARSMALAGALDPRRYRVTLAADSRYDYLMSASDIARAPLGTIPTGQFLEALSKGSPVYDTKTLEGYVKEDRELIERLRPDLVVGDFRLSLSVSARLEKVPYVSISNVYWSPYAIQTYPVPEIPLIRLVGLGATQALFNLIRPLSFAYHALPLNVVRKRFGLPSFGFDLRAAYTDADLTLYCDVPDLIDTAPMPAGHEYIGPVLWSPSIDVPDWWDRIDDANPVVFVSLGSSGGVGLLPVLLEALSELPVTVVAATVSDDARVVAAPNVFAAPFLPGELAASRSDLVVCNGGSPASYQALAAGVPVLGVPSNLDQFLNMSALTKAGLGILLRPGGLKAGSVKEAVETLLSSPGFKERAQGTREKIRGYCFQEIFPRLIEGVC